MEIATIYPFLIKQVLGAVGAKSRGPAKEIFSILNPGKDSIGLVQFQSRGMN